MLKENFFAQHADIDRKILNRVFNCYNREKIMIKQCGKPELFLEDMLKRALDGEKIGLMWWGK